MKNRSNRPSGRQPTTEKREAFVRLIRSGVSISEACRQLGIDRKTGHWWKNGGRQHIKTGFRTIAPIMDQYPAAAESGRFLSLEERLAIADGHWAGKSARTIAAELGRAVATVARELKRNSVGGEYRPHTAHAQATARRARPKPRRLETDDELRVLVQQYLDQRWSPEQIAHELHVEHGHHIAVETIYQALYAPQGCVRRDPTAVLRTGRPHRRPRRRGDRRRSRFIVPITRSPSGPPRCWTGLSRVTGRAT